MNAKTLDRALRVLVAGAALFVAALTVKGALGGLPWVPTVILLGTSGSVLFDVLRARS